MAGDAWNRVVNGSLVKWLHAPIMERLPSAESTRVDSYLGGGLQMRPLFFYAGFKFRVDIEGFSYPGWMRCGPILATIDDHGVKKYEQIELVRGASTTSDGADGDAEMREWFEKGGKRTADVVQYNRDNVEVRRLRLHGAEPVSFSIGPWDNGSDDILLTRLVIKYERFTREDPHPASAEAAEMLRKEAVARAVSDELKRIRIVDHYEGGSTNPVKVPGRVMPCPRYVPFAKRLKQVLKVGLKEWIDGL